MRTYTNTLLLSILNIILFILPLTILTYTAVAYPAAKGDDILSRVGLGFIATCLVRAVVGGIVWAIFEHKWARKHGYVSICARDTGKTGWFAKDEVFKHPDGNWYPK